MAGSFHRIYFPESWWGLIYVSPWRSGYGLFNSLLSNNGFRGDGMVGMVSVIHSLFVCPIQGTSRKFLFNASNFHWAIMLLCAWHCIQCDNKARWLEAPFATTGACEAYAQTSVTYLGSPSCSLHPMSLWSAPRRARAWLWSVSSCHPHDTFSWTISPVLRWVHSTGLMGWAPGSGAVEGSSTDGRKCQSYSLEDLIDFHRLFFLPHRRPFLHLPMCLSMRASIHLVIHILIQICIFKVRICMSSLLPIQLSIHSCTHRSIYSFIRIFMFKAYICLS